MQTRPSADSIDRMVDAARNQALDAAADLNARFTSLMGEAAELSKLDVLPGGIRTSFARLVREIENESRTINALLIRNNHNEQQGGSIVDLPSPSARKLP